MGILVRKNKVLLLHRRLKTPEAPENGDPDSWAFPGGGVDAGETPEQAIMREFREEVGLDVEIVPFGDEPVLGQVDDDLEHDLLMPSSWWWGRQTIHKCLKVRPISRITVTLLSDMYMCRDCAPSSSGALSIVTGLHATLILVWP
ncbi:NUDIX hydrolase domain-like protein [Aspergillus oleicola]